jgi:hypothetical protein
MITRREFLRLVAATGGALSMSGHRAFLQTVMADQRAPLPGSAIAVQAPQGTPLPGSAIPQFIDPLPLLSVAGGPMETIIAGASTLWPK